MTDSVAVFPPGYRLTDSSSGAPLSGAVVEFYDAGTTSAKTVYADADLTTAIGTTITTDSLGYPTSDGGTTKSLIWVGTATYKIVIKTSGGVTVATHDNVKGAVATVDSSDLSVSATRPVSTKSLSYTILSGDQNTVFVGNCSSGDITFTLPSAVTVGAGWLVTIQHAGSANQTLIATVSSQTLSNGATSYSTVMALSFSGEEVTLVSDGANWRVQSYVGPHIKRAVGVLTIKDRLTAPPGSEVQGDLYMISGTPSGAWSSFAAQDIVQFTSSAWVKFTPASDSGWLAYVQDEDAYYRYVGTSWETMAATQAQVETGTDDVRFVTPLRVKNHRGVCKAWARVANSGTPTLTANYNFDSSITDNGTGDVTLSITSDLSGATDLCVLATIEGANQANFICVDTTGSFPTAGAIRISTYGSGGAVADRGFFVAVYGDFA